MKRWLKNILLSVVVVAGVGALVYSFMPRPVQVDLETISRGELQVTVEEDGKTRIRERYIVSAPLSGRLRRITLKAGDRLERGATVAVIDPTDPDLLDPRAVAQAEARVRVSKASLERAGAALEVASSARDFAESEYKRAQELYERKTITSQELEERSMQRKMKIDEYRAMKFAQEVAKFELELAEAALLRSKPRSAGQTVHELFEIPVPPAPASGRPLYVLRVKQESETIVTPGTALLEVGDPTDLEIEVDVLSSDAVKIQPRDRMILEQWGGDHPLEARVRLIEPSGFLKISALGVEEQRVNVIGDFANPETVPSSLRDGFRVEAKIVIWEGKDILKVPNSALFRHEEQWAAFVVVGGRAVRRNVRIGHRSGLYAEVLAGLEEQDDVIVHPGDKVRDGVMVERRVAQEVK